MNLSSEAHSKRIREHHEHTLADTPQGVNIFLFIIFRLGQASIIPLFYCYIAIESYQHIRIWRYVLWILYRYIVIQRWYQARGFLSRYFLQPDKFQRCKSDFLAIVPNSDCLQNLPMPIYRPTKTKRSCGNVAQRLLQVACTIACSLLRLITSDKSSMRYWGYSLSQ